MQKHQAESRHSDRTKPSHDKGEACLHWQQSRSSKQRSHLNSALNFTRKRIGCSNLIARRFC